jgi:hypothetical protein
MNHRRAVGIATAVLALGAAGPAAARPYNIDSAGSFVPVSVGQTPAIGTAAAPDATGGGSALEYALIGAGGASVLLVGVGGTLAASRRRQASAARGSTLAT